MKIGTPNPPHILLALEQLAPVLDAFRGVLTITHVTAVHDQTDRADLGSGRSLLDHSLTRRNSDPIVQARHVQDIRRMHHDVDAAGFQVLALGVGLELVPLLRIGQKELNQIDAETLRGTDGVGGVADVCPDTHVSMIGGRTSGCPPIVKTPEHWKTEHYD